MVFLDEEEPTDPGLSQEGSEADKDENDGELVTSSSESDEDKENKDESSGSDSEDLDEETLNILGVIPELEEPKMIKLNKNLAARWKFWVQNGIKQEEREKLIAQYPYKCLGALKPPELNPEITPGLSDPAKKRDKHLKESQATLSAGLSAFGQGLTTLLKSEIVFPEKTEVLQQFSDAGKLMTGLFHMSSMSRRAVILPGVDKEYKAVLEDTKVDSFLFGENLGKKLKAAKLCVKSSQEVLKSKSTPKTVTVRKPLNQQGNFRGQPRYQGRARQAYQPKDPPRADYSRNHSNKEKSKRDYSKSKGNRQ